MPKKKKKTSKETAETSKEMSEKVGVCTLAICYGDKPPGEIDINPLQNNRKDGCIQKFSLKIKKGVYMKPGITSTIPTQMSCLWQRPEDIDTIGQVVNRSSMARLGFICNGGSIEGDYRKYWSVILVAPSIEEVINALSNYLLNPKMQSSEMRIKSTDALPLLLTNKEELLYKSSYKISVNDKYSIIIPIDELDNYHAQLRYNNRLVRTPGSAIAIELHANLAIAEVMIIKTVPMSSSYTTGSKKFKEKEMRLRKAYSNFRGDRGFGSTDKMK